MLLAMQTSYPKQKKIPFWISESFSHSSKIKDTVIKMFKISSSKILVSEEWFVSFSIVSSSPRITPCSASYS